MLYPGISLSHDTFVRKTLLDLLERPYFALPCATFAGARALVNRLSSGTWSTVEIMRERSGINWVWLRTLFKNTPFSPVDIIVDHWTGGGWFCWLPPVARLCPNVHFFPQKCHSKRCPWTSTPSPSRVLHMCIAFTSNHANGCVLCSLHCIIDSPVTQYNLNRMVDVFLPPLETTLLRKECAWGETRQKTQGFALCYLMFTLCSYIQRTILSSWQETITWKPF